MAEMLEPDTHHASATLAPGPDGLAELRAVVARVFGIEELLMKGPPALHPDLPGDSTGLLRLLSLASS